jgi:hypothetical protein
MMYSIGFLFILTSRHPHRILDPRSVDGFALPPGHTYESLCLSPPGHTAESLGLSKGDEKK